jgi:hypothetical protein
MSLMLFVQCKDDEEEPQPPVVVEKDPVADHTLLVYIAGENSLSGYCDPNVRAMQQGLLAADSTLNLVVFEDNQKLSQSLLFRLERHEEKIDTVTIATFDEDLNSADYEVMAQVVQLAFDACPARHNGVVLWSHAMSWIPSTEFDSKVANGATAVKSEPDETAAAVTKAATNRTYFGQDNTSYMELWDLRKALEAGPHLDYILVDACFFSAVEVAYELRGVTDYIMAAPTEVFGTGYPYSKMLPVLTQINDDNVEEKLVEAAKCFQAVYGTNGTLTVARTSGMEQLAQLWLDSRQKYPEVWEDVAAHPNDWFYKLQKYGRRRVGAYYYYYDFADLLDQVAAEAGATDTQTDVSAAVAFEFHSDIFTDGSEAINIRTCCGFSVSIPELFQLASNASRLNAGYPYTLWGQMTLAGEE